MTTNTTDLMRELDHRTNDGIDVRLLWCERNDRVHVAVRDAKTGEAFTVEVKAAESAMDVFRHPYAYAAYHRVDTRGERASAALDDAVAA